MACGMDLRLQLEALRKVYKKNLEDTVAVEDAIHIEVRLLPILSEDAMRALIREVLAEKGWTEGADGALVKTLGETVATLDAAGKTVTLKSKATATVSAEGRVRERDDRTEKESEKEASRLAEEKLAEEKKAAQTKLALKNLEELGRHEPALRKELQEALNRTYRRALEAKARELGEVESLQEQGRADGTYEVTVVVKA